MSKDGFTPAWENDSSYLFVNLEYNSSDFFEIAVCVDHKKFLPCRECMYGKLATTPYSITPADIEMVKNYQDESNV